MIISEKMFLFQYLNFEEINYETKFFWNSSIQTAPHYLNQKLKC